MGAVEFGVRIELRSSDGGVISAVWKLFWGITAVELVIGLEQCVVRPCIEVSRTRQEVVIPLVVIWKWQELCTALSSKVAPAIVILEVRSACRGTSVRFTRDPGTFCFSCITDFSY